MVLSISQLASGSVLPESRARISATSAVAGVQKIVRMASVLAPSLANVEIDDMWASFRPGTPDGYPLVGELNVSGLFVNSGHYRNGILLAPICAEIIAHQICTGTPHVSGRLLSPQRFVEGN